jgi:hypothetical protein
MIKKAVKRVVFIFILCLCFVASRGQLAIYGTTFSSALNTDVTVNGDVFVDKNSGLNMQGGLTLSGDFTGNGFFNAINKLTLFGKRPSNLLLQNGNIDTLLLSKEKFSKTFLSGDSMRINFLNFLNEHNYLFTNDTELSIFSTIAGGNENNFIHTNRSGLVGRTLSIHPVIFPVGNEINGYNPISISTSGQSGTEYARVGYVFSSDKMASFIESEPFWVIENNCPVHLYFSWGNHNVFHEALLDVNDLRLKGWDGTHWVLVGIDSLGGNVKNGYVKSRLILPFEFKYYTLESVSKMSAQDVIPGENIALYPTFPNPFFDGTKVHYTLKKESMVTMQIFNVEGHLMFEMKGSKSEGNHSEILPGSVFPTAGMYYLLLRSGKDILQTRLIHLQR